MLNSEAISRLRNVIGVNNDDSSSIRQVASLQQSDLSSCGVFVALNAWKLTHRRSLKGAPRVVDDGMLARQALARCIVRNSADELLQLDV